MGALVSGPVLVTGASGFIGSTLVEALVQRGTEVHCLLLPGDPAPSLSAVRDTVDVHYADLADRQGVEAVVRAARPEAILHLAAVGVTDVHVDPAFAVRVNVEGTLNLLDATRDHHVGQFVFASTSSVYGRTEQIPFVETDVCDRPLAPYPASKRAAEMLGFSYHHLYGQSFTAFRFFTVYGPRGRPDMMAYKVLDNIFFGKVG